MSAHPPRRTYRSLSLCASLLVTATGCTLARSVNGGLYAQPTANGHIPVGGVVSGQVAGVAVVGIGADATIRGTGDYGHVAAGVHLAGLHERFYGRLGFAPLAASYRDDEFWYATNTSLELGVLIRRDSGSTTGMLTTTSDTSVWSIGLRGDVEYRPGQGDADVFVSLLFGYAIVETTSARSFF